MVPQKGRVTSPSRPPNPLRIEHFIRRRLISLSCHSQSTSCPERRNSGAEEISRRRAACGGPLLGGTIKAGREGEKGSQGKRRGARRRAPYSCSRFRSGDVSALKSKD